MYRFTEQVCLDWTLKLILFKQTGTSSIRLCSIQYGLEHFPRFPVYFFFLSLKSKYSSDSACENPFWLQFGCFRGTWIVTTPMKNKQVRNDCGSNIT